MRERVVCHVSFHQEDLLSRSFQQTSIAGRPTLHAHLWLQGAWDTEYLALSASAVRVSSTSLEKEEGLVGLGPRKLASWHPGHCHAWDNEKTGAKTEGGGGSLLCACSFSCTKRLLPPMSLLQRDLRVRQTKYGMVPDLLVFPTRLSVIRLPDWGTRNGRD